MPALRRLVRLSLRSDSSVAGCRWGMELVPSGRGAVVRSWAEDGQRRVGRTRRLGWWRWWRLSGRLLQFDPEALQVDDDAGTGLDTIEVELDDGDTHFRCVAPSSLRDGPLARLVGLLSELGDCGTLMDVLDGAPVPRGVEVVAG